MNADKIWIQSFLGHLWGADSAPLLNAHSCLLIRIHQRSSAARILLVPTVRNLP